MDNSSSRRMWILALALFVAFLLPLGACSALAAGAFGLDHEFRDFVVSATLMFTYAGQVCIVILMIPALVTFGQGRTGSSWTRSAAVLWPSTVGPVALVWSFGFRQGGSLITLFASEIAHGPSASGTECEPSFDALLSLLVLASLIVVVGPAVWSVTAGLLRNIWQPVAHSTGILAVAVYLSVFALIGVTIAFAFLLQPLVAWASGVPEGEMLGLAVFVALYVLFLNLLVPVILAIVNVRADAGCHTRKGARNSG